jgi:hypothetical protein
MADEPLTRATLKTPKAAAIAGMLFSILLIIVFSLLRISVPADPQEPGAWLQTDSGTVALALNLVPFAGIAFLWFIGVLRERLPAITRSFIHLVRLPLRSYTRSSLWHGSIVAHQATYRRFPVCWLRSC